MEKYLLSKIASIRNLSIKEARTWIDAEIDAGRWSVQKTKKRQYFINLTSAPPWHDIFNLSRRKPNGRAWEEYAKLRDEKSFI
jgi:hypothetical protein